MGHCSGCDGDNKRLPHRYCHLCHAAKMREWRKTHRLEGEGLAHARARAYAHVYANRGKLSAPDDCELCGMPGHLVMHHPDYGRPLYVVWLHDECHHRVHREDLPLDTARALFGELRARQRRLPRHA